MGHGKPQINVIRVKMIGQDMVVDGIDEFGSGTLSVHSTSISMSGLKVLCVDTHDRKNLKDRPVIDRHPCCIFQELLLFCTRSTSAFPSATHIERNVVKGIMGVIGYEMFSTLTVVDVSVY